MLASKGSVVMVGRLSGVKTRSDASIRIYMHNFLRHLQKEIMHLRSQSLGISEV